MSLSFKQFNQFVEATEGEQLDEIFGMFKNAEEKAAAERQKLELLAKRGNESAKMKLRDMDLKADKANAAMSSRERVENEKFRAAKAHTDAAERGSSRDWDREEGSLRSNIKPKWNAATGKWERPTTWDHVGKHD